MIKVKHFEYAGYTTPATDTVVLADKFGNVVWRAHAASDSEEVRSGNVGWIFGLQEITHSSGYVLVYVE
jgi:hypothetical protein